MLTELRLQNFRCFQDHVVPFKSISIVIGRNNAGKSTLVEALRLIAIITLRYQALGFHDAPRWGNIPRREAGVSPSLKGMEFNFQTAFHRYGEPPAIITASFSDGSTIKVYLGPDSEIHAVITNPDGKVLKSRADAFQLKIPRVEIMHQVAPVAKNEVVLSEDYVKGALSSSLAPLHFRNQLKVLNEHFSVFKQLTEETWPSLQIRELDGLRAFPGEPLQLMVRDEGFVADIASMGHGLQMWLQTMWFIARAASSSPTIILDEPDVYMHPDLQRRLIRFLKGRFPQVIITTHSVEMMSEVDVNEILIIDKKRPKSRFAGTLPAVQKLIDHVGSVHNIQLAKLWNARRCILVEGKDIKLLSESHNSLFPESKEGLATFPNMSIGGWGGWNYAVGSSMLLRNAGGESIVVYCILDSDYHTETECTKRKQEAEALGVQLHIWERKEIENYCLIPSAVHRVIASKVARRTVPPTTDEIEEQMEEIIANLKNDVLDALSTEIHAQARALGSGGANKKARHLLDQRWATFEGRLSIVSGKEVISRLSQWSQDQFSVSLNAALIARCMTPSEIPSEMVEVITALEIGEPFPA